MNRLLERVCQIRPIAGVRERLASKSRGQALIYISIMMMTLFAVGALVTDGGLLWLNRRQMQNAVDAAALAGAQNLPKEPNDPAGARPVACDYANSLNGVPDMTVDCGGQGVRGDVACSDQGIDILVCRTYVANDSVRVTAHKTYRPIFGGGLGFLNIEIRTTATAMVGSIRSACIAPLFQTVDLLQSSGAWTGTGVALNTPIIMKFDTSGSSKGNFLVLNVGNGFSGVRERLGDPTACLGDSAPQTSGSVARQTGNGIGPFSQGMAARQSAWEAQGTCPSPDPTVYLQPDGKLFNGGLELTPETCYRVIFIPLLSGSFADFSGTSSPTQIMGFMTFYISDWCGNGHCPTSPAMERGQLLGYFVGFLGPGDIDLTPYDAYGSKVVQLIA